jgi:hypothetical protein
MCNEQMRGRNAPFFAYLPPNQHNTHKTHLSAKKPPKITSKGTLKTFPYAFIIFFLGSFCNEHLGLPKALNLLPLFRGRGGSKKKSAEKI